MTKPLQAMIWALSIIFVATLASQEIIDASSAATLLVVLPALASMQLSNQLCCLKNFRSRV